MGYHICILTRVIDSKAIATIRGVRKEGRFEHKITVFHAQPIDIYQKILLRKYRAASHLTDDKSPLEGFRVAVNTCPMNDLLIFLHCGDRLTLRKDAKQVVHNIVYYPTVSVRGITLKPRVSTLMNSLEGPTILNTFIISQKFLKRMMIDSDRDLDRLHPIFSDREIMIRIGLRGGRLKKLYGYVYRYALNDPTSLTFRRGSLSFYFSVHLHHIRLAALYGGLSSAIQYVSRLFLRKIHL